MDKKIVIGGVAAIALIMMALVVAFSSDETANSDVNSQNQQKEDKSVLADLFSGEEESEIEILVAGEPSTKTQKELLEFYKNINLVGIWQVEGYESNEIRLYKNGKYTMDFGAYSETGNWQPEIEFRQGGAIYRIHISPDQRSEFNIPDEADFKAMSVNTNKENEFILVSTYEKQNVGSAIKHPEVVWIKI